MSVAEGSDDVVRFQVPGLPMAQGSKRHVGHGVMVEMSKKLPAWRSDMQLMGQRAMAGRELLYGPTSLRAVFAFPRPLYHYGTGRNAGRVKDSAPGWKVSAPDLDKLVRALGDALTGVVIRDDAQICDLAVTKIYGQHPGVMVEVRSLR